MAKETIGYRVNADSAPIGVLNKMRKGLVAIYSERRNAQSYLGYYGGDAYPMSSEIQDPESNLVYGIVIANDGLGNGGFTHKSLNDFVNGDSDTTDEAKLGKFLRTLYGDGPYAAFPRFRRTAALRRTPLAGAWRRISRLFSPSTNGTANRWLRVS